MSLEFRDYWIGIPGQRGRKLDWEATWRNNVLASIRVGSDPEAIAAGAGSVWVANHFGRSVSRIDPGTDAVVATIPLDFLPLRVAAASGAVWAASNSIQQLVENQYARVSEIDPVVNRAAPPFKIYGSPCTPVLAAGSENGWIGTAFGRVFNLPSSGEAALFATVTAVGATAPAAALTR